MKSARKGDVVLYETASGRRRIGLIHSTHPNDFPAFARVRPYIADRQKWGGRQKVRLDAIMRRCRPEVRAEIEAALLRPPLVADRA